MDILANWLKNRYARAYGAAILVHLLLLFLQTPIRQALLVSPPVERAPESPPLAFEFVDLPLPEQSDRRSEHTPLLSNADRVSRDRQEADLPAGPLAYSDGVSKSKDAFETSPGQRRAERAVAENERQAERPAESTDGQLQQPFDFAEVLRQDPVDVQRQRDQVVLGRAALPQPRAANRQMETRALERGGLQLSTYAWNYAPYMAYLKRHIEDHIFPPRAFDLGMIDGKTMVKFRIYPDGRLEGLELLGVEGSQMLSNTSLKAVELSAPFRPLPGDFPDAFLEIIGTFEYLILRNATR